MGTSQNTYESFCDDLWRDWLAGRLLPSAFTGAKFDRESAPEPWLEFGTCVRPLVALTTNPGGSMEHQHRDVVLRGTSVIKPADTYRAATATLAHFYETTPKLVGSAARQRISAFSRLAELTGYDGVLQIETCPFHSACLPKKDSLLHMLETNHVLREYMTHLQRFLMPRPVLAVSAVSSRTSLSATAITQSEWLSAQAKLIGLDPARAAFNPLVCKDPNKKVTAAAFVDSIDNIPKALLLMMGGNHLPARAGLQRLAEALKRAGSPRAG